METTYIVLERIRGGLEMTKKKQSLKLPVSFKENIRDIAIYNYLTEDIKDKLGISTYIKMLVEEDMRKKDIWKYD